VSRATLRELLRDVPGARVMPPISDRDEEMGAFAPTQESTAEDADTVDGGPFVVTDVSRQDYTGFSHFLDGAQRSWKGIYVGFFPIYLAHTSAGIVERTGRDVQPPRPYLGDTEAFVPEGDSIAAVLKPGVEIVDFKVPIESTGMAVQDLALKRISERRGERELELGRGFTEGRLLVDGGIGKIVARDGAEQPFVIGLVKSHRKQYFQSRERVAAILGMRQGQRSSVFWRRAAHTSEADVYSCYLKLHESDGHGPLFGLVRVELPARDEFLGSVDEIAGWLLHERSPLSLPDARYDRMLYPIRLVEQHLKARQPSDAAIRAMIGV
jgi:hypothetical protein